MVLSGQITKSAPTRASFSAEASIMLADRRPVAAIDELHVFASDGVCMVTSGWSWAPSIAGASVQIVR